MKYPLILVHGIGAVDRLKHIHFWGRIPNTLELHGINVFLGETDSWGSFETNAHYLKLRIDEVLANTHAEKVNIIAHSKGGLDARYMFSRYECEDKVASLVTLNTPHRGAELADLLLKSQTTHSLLARKAMKTLGKLFLDKEPDPYRALINLSTESMLEFNEKNTMPGTIFFKSYYTVMKNGFDDLLFLFTHWYLKKHFGRNDGIVTEFSASWGENVERVKGLSWGGISHSEIVDLKKKRISGIDIPEIYITIARELSRMGF